MTVFDKLMAAFPDAPPAVQQYIAQYAQLYATFCILDAQAKADPTDDKLVKNYVLISAQLIKMNSKLIGSAPKQVQSGLSTLLSGLISDDVDAHDDDDDDDDNSDE